MKLRFKKVFNIIYHIEAIIAMIKKQKLKIYKRMQKYHVYNQKEVSTWRKKVTKKKSPVLANGASGRNR